MFSVVPFSQLQDSHIKIEANHAQMPAIEDLPCCQDNRMSNIRLMV
jgi:hypothetical protein